MTNKYILYDARAIHKSIEDAQVITSSNNLQEIVKIAKDYGQSEALIVEYNSDGSIKEERFDLEPCVKD